MALEGIGGVGALNVSSQTRTSSQASEAQSASVDTGAAQVQVESLQPVSAKGQSYDNNSDQRQQDRAGVQSDSGKEIPKEKIQAAVDDLNKQVKQSNPLHRTSLSFKYHDDTNRISITVTDSDTDEVIREIPPEKALDMLAKAWEMAGLLVDERR